MADRIAYIRQKRATLRKQLEKLSNSMTQAEYDPVEARVRYDRIKTLFHAYEELHDELAITELDRQGIDEMDDISHAFYTISSKIESERSTNTIAPGIPIGNSTFIEKQRMLKLPVAELPKFGGNLDQWLSFRMTFEVMVGSRSDISNLVKFMYLKNCLVGEAANKIAAYDVNNENYANAWALLTDAYERKRILISKHLDALFDIPKLTEASSKNLSKLIDTVRQHMNMLELLEYSPRDYVVVHLLEKALPSDIRIKWEESLSLDAIPTLKEFYTFIGGVVFRLHTMEYDNGNSNFTRDRKRQGDRESYRSKAKRNEAGTRVLVTGTSISCTYCRGDHVIYRCPVFEKLSVQQRWDSVKSKKLCRNCLRIHTGECTISRCKHCNRFHHSLLHVTRPKVATSSSTTLTNKPESNSDTAGRAD